jgi:hypothetical protein
MTAPLLSVTDLHTYYGQSYILQGLSLSVGDAGDAHPMGAYLDNPATGLSAASSPGAGALCTLEDVRSLMQMRDTDTEQDDIIEVLIAWASDEILRYTERELAPAGSTPQTRRFEIDLDTRLLNLTPYDAQSVSAVVLDPDDDDDELEATDWRLGPLPARDGVYRTLRLLTAQGTGRVEVDITGVWGFPAVPDPVRKAAAITVVTWLRRDVSAFSTTFNLDEGRVERPEGLPSAVRATLCSYRIETIG